MEKMQTFRAVPDAAILMESMRDIGYSLETALADIIDNSLTANASEIDIYTSLGDRPRIAIIDNGKGMSHDELLVAMRPGSWNPLGVRPPATFGVALPCGRAAHLPGCTLSRPRDLSCRSALPFRVPRHRFLVICGPGPRASHEVEDDHRA